ncbi:hypothetical protein [Marinobacter mobilis]|uniref:Uncharacterized protein n=1 Tax=Marinobacter mobilis TaxID=488533 RepID=A0A1H3DFB5_9GAMM|nr:hypothetical protein [Marinobacter mobilis]SDX65162.1 hypothetical protein SAMN04487960_11270 [Marinobacter mobilis]
MSLLTSLARMSAGLQQAASQRAQSQADTAPVKENKADSSQSQDDVTLSGAPAPKASSRLAINQYKTSVGQDTSYVRETLRHKIAEYGIHPGTRMSVSKAPEGTLALQAAIPAEKRQQIEQDLNNNQTFRDAFSRLSTNEPTVSFVDTAMKLNKAYGVSNPLLDSLVSENEQFNGLGDLVHRYDSIRRMVGAEQLEAAGTQQNYAFSLNARV